MFNIGGGELLVILVVALIVLGPTKLPEAARQAGRVMNQFRRMSSDFQREVQQAMNDPVAKLSEPAGSAKSKPSTDEAEPVAEHAATGANSDGEDTPNVAPGPYERSSSTAPRPTEIETPSADGSVGATDEADEPPAELGSGTDDPSVSTAERAGMYEIPAGGNTTEAL